MPIFIIPKKKTHGKSRFPFLEKSAAWRLEAFYSKYET
jgi:hypothetical protein